MVTGSLTHVLPSSHLQHINTQLKQIIKKIIPRALVVIDLTKIPCRVWENAQMLAALVVLEFAQNGPTGFKNPQNYIPLDEKAPNLN